MKAFIKKYPVVFSVILVELLSMFTFIQPSMPFGNVLIRIVLCAIVIFVLKKSDLLNILRFSTSSFARGLLSAILFFLFAIWVAVNNIIALSSQFVLSTAFFDFCIRMLMIGIFEEFCYRGLILNMYIKHREITKNTIYKAVLLSSLIFGMFHYLNLIKQPFLETSVQVFGAICIGVLFAAIYLKGMNIWVCAFLHALWNFANLYGSFLPTTDTGGIAERMSISQAGLSMIEPAIFLLIGLFILRNIHKEEYLKAIFSV